MNDAPSDSGYDARRHGSVERVAPWFASAVLHVGMIMLGTVVTWSVVQLDRRETTHIVADFDAVTYDPVAVLPAERIDPTPEMTSVRPNLTPIQSIIDRHLEVTTNAPRGVSPPERGSRTIELSTPISTAEVRFFGVSVTNARDVVYVLDASGSMITGWQDVLQELARSLRGLSSRQRYAVVVFKDEAIVVPPDRLRVAGELAWVETMQWVENTKNVVPSGPTNPLAAIERSMRLKPDVIFLLSQDITGHGRYEIDQVALLARLDQLNPVNRRTGERSVRINCIQFAEPDPLDTMRHIAEQHGGADGYKFLDRAELGLHRGDDLDLERDRGSR